MNARPPSARLFFALWPEPAMQAALAAATDPVLSGVEAAGDARRVPTENFHLTLAFLGSVPLDQLAGIDEIASLCAGAADLRGEPVEVVLDEIECWRKSQILCATGSTTPLAASRLAESLKRGIAAAPALAPDFNRSEPPFRAHVTIARKVRRSVRRTRIEPQVWRFRSFVLVESKTRPQGSTYTVVATYPLL